MFRALGIAWVGLAILAGVFPAGCKSEEQVQSGVNESCTRTDDCVTGLFCVANTCVTGAGPGSDGGTAPAEVLGEEGDSCQRRADCSAGLACIQQTCATGPSATEAQRLGDRGESCTAVVDCAPGLTCLPLQYGIGICDVASYPFEPTGKVCGGECNAAADCCELPLGNVLGVASCEDIVQQLGGDAASACASASGTVNDTRCFVYNTYCRCTNNPWTCTENQCVYAAACQKDGEVTGGCPALSRIGRILSATCDTAASRCQAALSPQCQTATECTGKLVVDDVGDQCSPGECTCYQSACYRMCDSDLDCAVRTTCDQAKKVCVTSGTCAGDAECSRALRDVTAKCQDGACVVPCTSDHQCSSSGVNLPGADTYFNGLVCSSKGICEDIGCAADAECGQASGVKTFCVTATPASAGAAHSAITD